MAVNGSPAVATTPTVTVGGVAVPVISAEEGKPVGRLGPLHRIAGRLRRGLEPPVDEKVAALREVEPFSEVGVREMRRLASLFLTRRLISSCLAQFRPPALRWKRAIFACHRLGFELHSGS